MSRTARRRTQKRPVNRADAVRARRKKREQRRTSRAIAMARTPRDLAAARERRASRARRTRRGRGLEWRAVVGAAEFAPGVGSLARPRLSIPRVGWRLVSLMLVVLFGTLLAHTMTAPDYFIDSINLAGARFVPGDEIYRAAGVHALNVFWLDPSEIEANIESISGIQDATVVIDWPVDILVEVQEREPVLAWSQGGGTVWVGKDGMAFAVRGELSGLLPILVDDADQPWPLEAQVPAPVIEGALELKALRPNIELLHYDSRQGLSYQDGRGWRGHFGVGAGMEARLVVYETLIDDLMARNIYPAMIDVSDPDAPYYRK